LRRPTPEIRWRTSLRRKPIWRKLPIGAFTAAHDDPASDAALIQYVSTFVPKMSGENFNPHVSTGVAPTAYLDAMLAEPFKPFTFSPAGAAIYQLGPFGTAAKKLSSSIWNQSQLSNLKIRLWLAGWSGVRLALLATIHSHKTNLPVADSTVRVKNMCRNLPPSGIPRDSDATFH
jgi:hypothetical protein